MNPNSFCAGKYPFSATLFSVAIDKQQASRCYFQQLISFKKLHSVPILPNNYKENDGAENCPIEIVVVLMDKFQYQ
jgi:hypothetical protein